MRNLTTRLEAAADLLERTGWCRRAMARDGLGRPVEWNDPFAVCYCIIGAIKRTAHTPTEANYILAAVSKLLDERLDTYNDRKLKTQQAAVEFLRDAAAIYGVKASERPKRLSTTRCVVRVNARGRSNHALCL